jgi:hypothetical protein
LTLASLTASGVLFWPLLCKTLDATRFAFAIAAKQADFFGDIGGRRMSFAVPIILALALAASYSGHFEWNWQTYRHEQMADAGKPEDESSKNEDKKNEDNSSQKNKSGQNNKAGKSGKGSASSKDKGDARTMKRQE